MKGETGGDVVQHLLLPEDEVVELLLQHLVRVIDEELLEVVVIENLETFRFFVKRSKVASFKSSARRNT